MLKNKIIVTIAPTGGMAKKSQNPNLPTQPDEIAESVHRCYNAGASVVAIHARRPDDEATCNADIYRRINALVRERCKGMVINNSTGGGVDGDMLANARTSPNDYKGVLAVVLEILRLPSQTCECMHLKNKK